MRTRGLAILSVLTVAGVSAMRLTSVDAAAPAGEQYWPQWRGPLMTGLAPHATPPVEWSETKNVRFKVALPGPGHATPVVWGNRIYLLAAAETEREAPTGSAAPRDEKATRVHRFVVLAFDRNTGETIWETTVREELPHEAGHATASFASASPVTDGEHVWASFGSRGLYCLDRDGKVVWNKDLGEMHTRNEFGEGASPALHGDTLVVNWDHEGDSFVVALDKRSGEERWRAARDEPTSWATPVFVEDGGRTLVVVSATNRVRAYDLKTGAEVWQFGGLGVNVIPTPVVGSGTLFVMSGYRDPQGIAFRYPGAKGDMTGSDAVAWKSDRNLSYVPSPLLDDGKLYFVKRFSGVLSCVDLQTGRVLYEEQRVEGLSNVYGSPAAAAGRAYLIDRDGAAAVFKTGAEFELLASNKLDDAFDASPVIVGDHLYLRGHRWLYAIAEDD